MRLSTIDRKILNCVQEDIPLSSKPFKILSKRIGLKENRFLRGLSRLKGKGIIRSFAVGINHRRLGYETSLVALKVSLNKIEEVAKKVIRYKEVTHCFLREGKYNLWVVFICLRKEDLNKFLRRFSKIVGKGNVLNLPTKKQFKLNTRIKI